jgi:DNA topoisomerase III
MPDFRYRQTTATLDVRGFEFRAAGRQPIDLGWRAALASILVWISSYTAFL